MMPNRNKTKWTDCHGKTRLVKDLADEHLANILRFLKEYGRMFPSNLKSLMAKEADRRGLSKTFLSGPQTPHIGPDGKWHMLDMKRGQDLVISGKKAKTYGN